MKGAHDICIIESGGGYRVKPPAWSVDPKKNVNNPHPKPVDLLIRNLTSREVLVILPNIVDSSVATSPGRKFTLGAMGSLDPTTGMATDWKTVPLLVNAAAGSYTYSVIVDTAMGTTAAVGDSEPIIIIDPPA
jgi:hypothetical protein